MDKRKLLSLAISSDKDSFDILFFSATCDWWGGSFGLVTGENRQHLGHDCVSVMRQRDA